MLAGQTTAGERRETAQSASSEEAGLFHRVSKGDMRAFEELYRIYHPRVTRFLMNMTRRPQLTEEVLNDTMFVVWNRPDSFNGKSKLSTWIFAIAYRKALKAMRRQDQPLEDKDADESPSGEPGPEQVLGQRQAQALLRRAISELSPDHRAVVDLSYFHAMGYREIADVMACPVDTVKTRMFHARRHLKTRLAGQFSDWL
jgi:RNA polymerase sigma-70 factor (ECF subfamily)